MYALVWFQLVLTVMLTCVVVYLYTVIAFNFFRKFYIKEEDGQVDYKCHDMATVSELTLFLFVLILHPPLSLSLSFSLFPYFPSYSQTNAQARSHTCIWTGMRMCTQMHTDKYAHTHSCIHACKHTYAFMQA